MTYPKVSTDPLNPENSGVPASPRFPQIEERVLAYWEDDKTFAASVENRPAGDNGSNEFVFYDGPPFANGLPHYGHLLTGYVKDIVPRYQTMKGKRVERRFGWDTHGLPAELEAMKQLGITTTDEITEMGIDVFNDACRSSVLKYTDVWRDYVTRQARWVDFDNDYKTMNPEFMESVIWAFKQLFDKGYVYEGFRVLPYCWQDETPLSNHELRMDDDVYQMRQDPAVTVGYDITTDGPFQGAKLLIWTTTPWTLPSNLAVMVGEEIEYVAVESDGPTGTPERYILAAARVAAYKKELFPETEEPVITWRGPGSELLGLTYTPPFSYYVGHENAFRVVEANEAVTTDSGSGLVHTAGAFGEVDKEVTDREGIEAVMPVGKDGKFTAPVAEYKGQLVFDANKPILADLRAVTRGEAAGAVTPGTVLVRHESYEHSYPHCWRCRQPLIYKGVSSWFVEVTAIKARMAELNQQITWTPEHIKDGQFGKWIDNARDWSITRNRFWGSPVPVWKSDNEDYPRIDVYGSFAEIERDFGRLPLNKDGEPDLHRPFIDDLTRPNPDDPTGQSTMRRVTDVLDVWFDSGSMSFAQNHVPFENAEWFQHHFPADFIVEYIGQTRGWFYTLHILATALFDRPAFQSCISHGIVLGSDGNKMSKSLRNYPDVSEVLDRDGADAMRWFLMASPILRGGNLVVTEQGIRDSVRQVMIPLWNSWYFFSLYANAAGIDAEWSTSSEDQLDRYILAKAREFVGTYTAAMDSYAIAEACEATGDFVDLLTNWYIRRSRERFWSEDRDAFNTLYTVLEVTTRTIAPLLPLVAEEIWRGLTGGRSVHLADLPKVEELPGDDALVAAMDAVREVCSTTSSLRKARRLRNRLPLGGLTLVGTALDSITGGEGFAEIVADEVNVKAVRLLAADAPEAAAYGVEQKLTVNARAAGPRLGKDVQLAIKGSKSGDWSVDASGVVTAGGLALVEGEYTLETVAGAAGDEAAVAMLPGGGFVVLDTVVTPELASEGLARDLIRAVQNTRKETGLEVSDRIELTIAGGDVVQQAATEHGELIARETLATTYAVTPTAAEADPGAGVKVGEGDLVHLTVVRA